MSFFFLLVFFLLGAIIGSFLNVVTLRYGTKKLSGRSLCFSCGKTLRWFELIPILSFFVQKGRCRGCKSGISRQYPLVEFVTGCVFSGVFLKFLADGAFSSPIFNLATAGTIFIFALHLALWSLLIALSVYDLKHKIIPNVLVYGSCFVSLLLFGISYFIVHSSALLNFWSGFLFATPFALIWFFSRGRAMGLGDAKLILLFPWFLGFAKGLSALVVGFWLGAAAGLGALVLKALVARIPTGLCPNLCSGLKRLSMKSELPLGPFLVAGLLLVYLFGWDVTGLGMLLG